MNSDSTVKQSTFVTVLAWVFIVLTGFTTIITALQNVMLHVMSADFGLNNPDVSTSPGMEQMPAIARFIFIHFNLIFAAFFIISLTVFIASIGLLKRKNWARLLFIAMLSFGIIWNIGGLVLQQYMMSNLPFGPGAPQDIQRQMDIMMLITRIVSAVFALGFSLLYGWIIWKLSSLPIVSEFKTVSVGQVEHSGR